jgi:hypothetical protein
MEVAFIHPPLAYALKSSPGATDLSMPAASIPEGNEVAAGAPAGDDEHPAEIARAPMRTAVATRFTDHSPVKEAPANIIKSLGDRRAVRLKPDTTDYRKVESGSSG